MPDLFNINLNLTQFKVNKPWLFVIITCSSDSEYIHFFRIVHTKRVYLHKKRIIRMIKIKWHYFFFNVQIRCKPTTVEIA
jgi:hypothetical protein